MHGNGHSNFSIYVNSANYVYFKFWTATTKLEGSSTGIWYTGNYKDFQLQNLNETTSIPSSNRSQTNASIDGGYSFSSNLNYENNLRGMTYLTQDLTTGSFPNTFVGMQGLNTNPLYFGHLFSTEVTIDGNSYEAVELNYNYRSTFIEDVLGFEGYTSINAKLDTLDLQIEDLGDYLTLKCTNSTLLNYNQVYLLHVDATIEEKEYTLEEEIIFIKPNTVIQGGVIVSEPSRRF